MKLRYRILILFLIFTTSLIYFGSNMSETVFNIEKKTMAMAQTTLPYVSIQVDDQQINLLHGYAVAIDAKTMRESVTPLSKEQTMTVTITENKNVVKKLNYEVIDLSDGSVFEEGTVTALTEEENHKEARIKLKKTLSENTEYAFKITLITSKSKRVYFYTRIILVPQNHLAEKLAFVEEFHEATFQKDSKDQIEKYLEKPSRSNTDFSEVTIHDSYDLVTYGELKPKVIFRQLPVITEIAKDTASISLSSLISIETSTGTEYYNVTENFRFLYSPTRSYLYDYNRSMEAVFDINKTSLKKSELKLGITSHTKVDTIHNEDNSIIAFVRNGELYSYSTGNNTITRVFSFAQKNTDYIRDSFADHDIKILSMDESGNMDFMVYGYMNRGEYEGRTGIILYHYDRTLERIEEQLYIPINTTFQILKEQIGDFCYRNAFDVFYFEFNQSVYSYNLTTKELKVIVSDVQEQSFVYSRKGKFIAFQNGEKIEVYDLENASSTMISGQNNEQPILLGLIDQNIIYGYLEESKNVTQPDGTPLPLYHTICISSRTNQIVKEYKKDGYQVSGISVDENVIQINLVKLTNNSTKQFEIVDPDFILNMGEVVQSRQKVTKRVTEQMMTEYYLALGTGVEMSGVPKLKTTLNTIINEERTVRINEKSASTPIYVAYAFGKVEAYSREAGEVIKAADRNAGIVMTNEGKTVWERGVKSRRAQISDLSLISSGQNKSSLKAAMSMLLDSQNISSDVGSYDRSKETAEDYLSSKMKGTVIRAEDITLDQALYYIHCGSPVITFNKNSEAVVLTAYDSDFITVFEPASGVKKRMTRKEGRALIETGNNLIIAYVQ